MHTHIIPVDQLATYSQQNADNDLFNIIHPRVLSTSLKPNQKTEYRLA